MYSLPDETRSNSNSGSEGQTKPIAVNAGWEIDLKDLYEEKIDHKLIKLANSRLSLETVFKKFNIHFEEVYSATGWTLRTTCPFKDHSDRTPSFGYNQKENFFNCFGCHRAGKAVEFIAYFEGKPKIMVAKNIVAKIKACDDNFADFVEFDYKRLQKLLFDFSDTICEFRSSYSNSELVCEYIESLTWPLDVYMRYYYVNNSVDFDNLEALISKLEEQISYFKHG